MHELSLLADLVVILSVALVVAWSFSKLRLPTIVGFLAAGVLLGPGVFEIVSEASEISFLAEIGVVLLLFSIGLELSLEEVGKLGRFVFGAGTLQLFGTAALIGAGAYAYGFAAGPSVFFGLLGGLSSTAIVLTSLRESGEVGSMHGRGMVGVLVFQDLAVVPLILILPLLGGTGGELTTVIWTLVRAGGMVVAVWLAATYLFPYVADRVVNARRRELFTLFTVVVAFGTAYLSGAAGLSLALGAFLAGLVISESPYSEQMIAEIEPFKDVFNSLFFVSMGLLVDPGLFVQHPVTILGLSVGVIAVKAVVLVAIILALGYGPRVAVLVGLGISQVGEFSFILAHEGLANDLMTEPQYGLFLAAAVLTMAATPFFLRYSGFVADLLNLPALERWFGATEVGAEDAAHEGAEHPEDHVVIIGFGRIGQNLAESLRRFGVDYVVTDLNPNTVRRFRDEEPIFYGDATRTSILRHLGVEKARALIVTVPDVPIARRIVDGARRLHAELEILARARFDADTSELYSVGADHVVVEEFETSLELVAQILEAYEVPAGKVLREKDGLRRRGYGVSGPGKLPEEPEARHTLEYLASTFHTDFVRLPIGASAAGKTIEQVGVRRKTGATILAVGRDKELIEYPTPTFELHEWDHVLLIGPEPQVGDARKLLQRTE